MQQEDQTIRTIDQLREHLIASPHAFDVRWLKNARRFIFLLKQNSNNIIFRKNDNNYHDVIEQITTALHSEKMDEMEDDAFLKKI